MVMLTHATSKHTEVSAIEDFRKSILDMETDNGLPYESVPPVQIRTYHVHSPYKEQRIIYLHSLSVLLEI